MEIKYFQKWATKKEKEEKKKSIGSWLA